MAENHIKEKNGEAKKEEKKPIEKPVVKKSVPVVKATEKPEITQEFIPEQSDHFRSGLASEIQSFSVDNKLFPGDDELDKKLEVQRQKQIKKFEAMKINKSKTSNENSTDVNEDDLIDSIYPIVLDQSLSSEQIDIEGDWNQVQLLSQQGKNIYGNEKKIESNDFAALF